MSARDLTSLLALERRVWEALRTGDVDADLDLLAPGFLGVYPSGYGDRSDHVARLADGPTVASYDIADTRLITIAAGYVLLAYRASYRRSGSDVTETMYVSSLWSQLGGRWVNVFSQDTPAGDQDSVV